MRATEMFTKVYRRLDSSFWKEQEEPQPEGAKITICAGHLCNVKQFEDLGRKMKVKGGANERVVGGEGPPTFTVNGSGGGGMLWDAIPFAFLLNILFMVA